MLTTKLQSVQANKTQHQQVPHRAPMPKWANGQGEEGHAREGETTTPASNGLVSASLPILKRFSSISLEQKMTTSKS